MLAVKIIAKEYWDFLGGEQFNSLLNFNLQENEKLYLQMKALQAQSKQNEEAMFAENQKLLTELAITK